MKKTIIVFCLLTLVFIPVSSHAKQKIPESAKAAVKALKKLEARIQAGISYRDYAPALGDAKFDVNMFVQGNDAKGFDDLKASIIKTMSTYDLANSIWNSKIAGTGNFYSKGDALTIDFFKLYPEANKSDKDGGVWSDHKSQYTGESLIFVDTMIQYLFSEASKETAKSFAMLNKK